MENSVNYEYISKLPLEWSASLKPGKISSKLFPKILQDCEVIVLEKNQKWLLRKENTEEYLVSKDEQGYSLELYSRKKLFKRLLPDYYNDPAYVYPPTKNFLDSISDTLEQIHEQMRYEFQNALYTTCKNLWALSEHQKLWDFLGITPELDIFRQWIASKTINDNIEIMKVQDYLSQLCIERIQTMASILLEGAGTRDSIQKAFCAFFHYILRYIIKDDNKTKHYILAMDENQSNTVELVIEEPIQESTCWDKAQWDQSYFDNQNLPGFTLWINSNFDQFSILPVNQKISNETYKQLDDIAKAHNEKKGKEYFENLIFLIKAAGVQSRIYYTIPILPNDGSKYHKIELYCISQEVQLSMPQQTHRLSWAARFDQDCFDQCLWAGDNLAVKVHQNISTATNSQLQEANLLCYNLCITMPSELSAKKTGNLALSLAIQLPATEQLWQESKWDQARFDQSTWSKPALSWLTSPARFDRSLWDKTLFA